jgi:hypothetical protein
MGEGDFLERFRAVDRHINQRYGVPVVITDVLDPNTGAVDGERIQIDYDQTSETALFVLCHLFGHTAQWTTSRYYRSLARMKIEKPGPPILSKVKAYERRASRMGLQLLHEAGVRDVDAWLSDWAEADYRYLKHFYFTGEAGNPRRFLVPGSAPLLRPLKIPDFRPRQWFARYAN